MEITPTFEEFQRLAAQGDLVAIKGSILADRLTAVTAFEAIEHEPYAFLLESVEGGATLGRYSFLGFAPAEVFTVYGDTVDRLVGGKPATTERSSHPLAAIREAIGGRKAVVPEGFPPFTGGAVAMIGYEMVRTIERLPEARVNDLGLPDAIFMIAESVVAIDHVRRRIDFITNIPTWGDLAAAYRDGVTALHMLRRIVMAGGAKLRPEHDPPRVRPAAVQAAVPEEFPVEFGEAVGNALLTATATFSKPGFEAAVERAREYIHAGDAFQVVLSQRFRMPYACRPFDIYRSLRDVNPSPYMFYLQVDGVRFAGSSPEILVRLEGREACVRPIAGTRPRGRTEREDAALEAELLADEKERAEHLMLVDLGRNDLGRVAVPGTVRADRLYAIERYSHVMHIVSNVRAELAPDCDAFALLEAAFPAGTVTGAPKIRAMEIIDELEPVRRGPYAGAVGYFSFNGNLDSCIMIRTAVLSGGEAYVQAGAGIVADSDPAAEYRETLNKAAGVLRAVTRAQAGLD